MAFSNSFGNVSHNAEVYQFDLLVTSIKLAEKYVHFWAQTNPDEGMQVTSSMTSFQTLVVHKSEPPKSINPGEFCLARFADEKWYRAKVISVPRAVPSSPVINVAEVFSIDYGKTAVVPLSDIRLNVLQYFTIPAQAKEFILADVHPKDGQCWSHMDRQILQSKMEWKVFSAFKLCSVNARIPLVRLLNQVTKQPFLHELMAHGVVRIYNNQHFLTSQYEPLTLPPIGLKSDDLMDVFVSYSLSPDKFWIQLASQEGQLDKLRDDMHNYYDRLAPQELGMSIVDYGTLCAVKSSIDDCYYRAVIREKIDDQYDAFFIDYGNCELHSIQHVKALAEPFKKVPSQACECYLAGIPPGQNYSENIVAFFRELVNNKLLKAKFGGYTPEGSYLISLITEDGMNVKKSLDAQITSMMQRNPDPVQYSMSGAGVLSSPPPGYKSTKPDINAEPFSPGALPKVYTHPSMEYMPMGSMTVPGVPMPIGMALPQQQQLPQMSPTTPALVPSVRSVSLTDQFRGYQYVQGAAPIHGPDRSGMFPKFPKNVDGSPMVPPQSMRVVSPQVAAISPGPKQAPPLGLQHPPPLPPMEYAEVDEPDVSLGSKEKVFITNASDQSRFFGQLVKYPASDSDDLATALMAHYGAQKRGQQLNKCFIGQLCASLSKQDSFWYRARVQSVQGMKATVFFIDYGDTETDKPIQSLCVLEPQFCKLPRQGIMMRMASPSPDLSDAEFTNKLVDSKYIVSLDALDTNGVYDVTFTSDDENSDILPFFASTMYEYTKTSVDLRTKAAVNVPHVLHPESFYCRLTSFSAKLDDLMDEMEQYYSQGKSLVVRDPQIGMLVTAQYTVDDGWYRAVVTSADKTKVELHYIDYGNNETVMRSGARIRVIRPEFTKLPAQALHCKLDKVTKSGAHWSTSEIEKFQSVITEPIIATFHDQQDTGVYGITLINADGVNVNDSFRPSRSSAPASSNVNAVHAPATVAPPQRAAPPAHSLPTPPRAPAAQTAQPFAVLKLKVNESRKVAVAWTNSPSNFYCQLDDKEDDLNRLMEEVACAYDNLGVADCALNNPMLNQACCAKFSDDDAWYRAVVTEVNANKTVTVHFMDYGNSETMPLTRIKRLMPNFFDVPAMALKCKMESIKPRSSPVWTDAATDVFSQLTMDKKLVATIISVNGDEYSVELKDDQNNEDISNAMVVKGQAMPISQASRDAAKAQMPVKEFSSPPKPKNTGGEHDDRFDRDDDFADKNAGRMRAFGASAPNHADGPRDTNTRDVHRSGSDNWRERRNEDQRQSSGGYPRQDSNRSGGGFSPKKDEGFNSRGGDTFGGSRQESKFGGRSDGGNRDGSGGFSSRNDTGPRGGGFGSKPEGGFGGRNEGGFKSNRDSSEGSRDSGFRGSESGFGGKSDGGFGERREGGGSFGGNRAGFDRKDGGFRQGDSGGQSKGSFGGNRDGGRSFEGNRDASKKFGSSRDGGGNFGRNSAVSDGSVGFSKSPKLEVCSPWDSETCPEKYPAMNLPVGKEVPVTISWSTSANDFWCQLTDDLTQFNAIMAEIQQHYSTSQKKIDKLEIGSPCAAMFTDKNWYRATIVQSGLVLFVDFGNAEKVNVSDCRPLIERFMKLSPRAFHCRFENCESVSDSWTQEARQKYQIIMDKPNVKATIVATGDLYSVTLKSDGKDAVEQLVGAGLLRRITPQTLCYRRPKVDIGSNLSVILAHIDSPLKFYVQSSDTGPLDALMGEIEKHCTSCASAAKPELGAPVLAIYREDSGWYRANVSEITSPETVAVHYVDYGNNDTVKVSDTRAMTQKFVELPVQAMRCQLSDVRILTTEMTDAFAELAAEQEANIVIDGTSSDGFSVKLVINEEDVNAKLAAMMPEGRTFPQAELGEGRFACMVSHVDSPAMFHLQLVKHSIDIQEMSDKLQEMEHNVVFETAPNIGTACVAKFSCDDLWYRARVTAIDGELVTVVYVDYGNGETCELSALRQISAELAAQPPLAVQCSLGEMVYFSASEIDRFEGVTSGHFLAEFERSEPFLVRLYDVNKNEISRSFIASHTCLPEQSAISGQLQGFLSHSNCVDDFYIQLSSEEELLNSVVDELEKNALSYTLVENPSIGLTCAVQFSEDNAFYRAEIIDQKADMFTVRFVDYGNGETVDKTKLRHLPQSLMQRPAFARHCKLELGRPDLGVEKLQELTGDDELIIEFLTSTSPYNVRIFGEGETNLSAQLIDTEAEVDVFTMPEVSHDKTSGTISYVDNLGRFFVSVTAWRDDALLAAIDAHYAALSHRDEEYTDHKLGARCAASLDGKWRRCQVQAIYDAFVKIVDVDSGLSGIAYGENLKILSENFCAQPTMAVECCVALKHYDTALVDEFKRLTVGKELNITFSTITPPFSIDIMIDDEDIVTRLAASKQLPSTDLGLEATLVSYPPPTIEKSSTGFVSFAVSASKFYVQTSKRADNLRELDEKIGAIYSTEQKSLEDVVVGQPCAAYCTEYVSWYRARVLSIDADSVLVQYVDYGNTEKKKRSDIKVLASGLESDPPYAIECCLANAESVNAAKFVDAVLDVEFSFEFLTEQTAPFTVKLFTDGKVMEFREPDATVQPKDLVTKPTSPAKKLPPASLSVTKAKGFIPFGVSPVEFYVQLAEQEDKLNEMNDKITAIYEKSSAVLACPEKGQICSVYSAEYSAWYRGSITSIEDDLATVKFVDYGNSETVTKSELKILEPSLLNVAPFALKCTICTNGQTYRPSDIDKFLTATKNKDLEFVFLSRNEPYVVTILEEDCDLSAPFIRLNYKQAQIDIGKSIDCYVSHVTSPQCFYVQLAAKEDERYAMIEKIETELKSSKTALQEIEIGSICCTFLRDSWNRCLVTDINNDDVTVQYVDDGSTNIVLRSECYNLPNHFLELPKMALQCTLKDKKKCEWSDKDAFNFRGQVLDKLLTIVCFNRTEPCVITISGEEVELDEFIDEKEDPKFSALVFEIGTKAEVYVTHHESPSEFWIQPKQYEKQLDELMERLEAYDSNLAMTTPLVGVACVVPFDDDGYYRAEITSVENESIGIRYVDYGNTEDVSLEEMKSIEDEDLKLPGLAVRCSLFGCDPDVDSWSDEVLAKFTSAVDEKTLLCEFVDNVESVYRVRLLDMGISVLDVLGISHEKLNGTEAVEKCERVEPVELAKPTCKSSTELRFTPQDLKTGLQTEVCLSVTNDPTSFYCQNSVSSEDLPLLMDSIHEYCEQDGVMVADVHPGAACIAQYSDNAWYRGLIESVEDDVTVRFVDYGNSDVVARDQIYQILPEHLDLPVQAFKCSLPVRPLETEWDDACCTRFTELTTVEEVKIVLDVKKVSYSDNGQVELVVGDLSVGGKSVSEQLVNGGYARPADMEADSSDSMLVPDKKKILRIPSIEITEAEKVVSESDQEEATGSEDATEDRGEETTGSEDATDDKGEEATGSEDATDEKGEEATGSEDATEDDEELTTGDEIALEDKGEVATGSEDATDDKGEEATGSEDATEDDEELTTGDEITLEDKGEEVTGSEDATEIYEEFATGNEIAPVDNGEEVTEESGEFPENEEAIEGEEALQAKGEEVTEESGELPEDEEAIEVEDALQARGDEATEGENAPEGEEWKDAVGGNVDEREETIEENVLEAEGENTGNEHSVNNEVNEVEEAVERQEVKTGPDSSDVDNAIVANEALSAAVSDVVECERSEQVMRVRNSSVDEDENIEEFRDGIVDVDVEVGAALDDSAGADVKLNDTALKTVHGALNAIGNDVERGAGDDVSGNVNAAVADTNGHPE